MADHVTDLEADIKDWVWEYRINQRDRYRYNFEDLEMHVIMDKVKYTFDKPNFTNPRKRPPSAHVVYTSNYTNNTDDSQEVDIKVKRVTSATAKAKIKHGFTADYGVGLKMRLPSDVVGTFGGGVIVDAEDEESIERKMTWTFSTKMIAPPRRKTVAKFEVNEEHKTFDFSTYVHLHGKVKVEVYVKYTGERLQKVEEEISTILDEYLPEADRFSIQENLIYLDGKNASARWPFRGTMDFHYGISQNEVIE